MLCAHKSLEYGDIQVSGDTATAKTVEVWTVTFYSQPTTKSCWLQALIRSAKHIPCEAEWQVAGKHPRYITRPSRRHPNGNSTWLMPANPASRLTT